MANQSDADIFHSEARSPNLDFNTNNTLANLFYEATHLIRPILPAHTNRILY